MAVAVVNKKQTGSAAAATLTIPSATAGHLLIAFITQIGSTTAPTGKDNVSGSTGWTVNATRATWSVTNTVWLATKVAVGGETLLEPTPGGAATMNGITYFEASGTSATIDLIEHTDNGSNQTSLANKLITLDAGDLIVAGVGLVGSSGAVLEWTEGGPLTNVETASTRALGGYYIPGTTVSIQFKANWTTARSCAMLAVALKPAAESTPVTVSLNAAASTSSASNAITAGTEVALDAATGSTSASASVNAVTVASFAPAQSASSAALSATATTTATLAPASSTSSATASVTAATRVTLPAASSASSATLAAHAVALVALSPASAASLALALVTVPTRVILDPASSTSAASLTLGVSPTLTLGPASSESSATATIAIERPPLNPPTNTPVAGHVAIGRVGHASRNTGTIAYTNAGRARR